MQDMGSCKQEGARALCLPNPSELDVSMSVDFKADENSKKEEERIQSSKPAYMPLMDVSSLIMSGVMWGTAPLELIAK